MKRSILVATLFAAVLSMSGFADDGGRHGNNGQNGDNGQNNQNNQNNQSFFNASLIGSTPGVMIGGVASGGAPWVVRQGSASVGSNGRLEVNVSGLLLGPGAPPNLVGTVGPVQMVAASLVCGGSGGMVVGSSAAVFLNASGKANIEDSVSVPAACVAPVVLIRIFNPAASMGSQLGSFIAITGIAGSNTAPGNGNHEGHDN